jgi:hypothetical protein
MSQCAHLAMSQGALACLDATPILFFPARDHASCIMPYIACVVHGNNKGACPFPLPCVPVCPCPSPPSRSEASCRVPGSLPVLQLLLRLGVRATADPSQLHYNVAKVQSDAQDLLNVVNTVADSKERMES